MRKNLKDLKTQNRSNKKVRLCYVMLMWCIVVCDRWTIDGHRRVGLLTCNDCNKLASFINNKGETVKSLILFKIFSFLHDFDRFLCGSKGDFFFVLIVGSSVLLKWLTTSDRMVLQSQWWVSSVRINKFKSIFNCALEPVNGLHLP